MNHAEIAGHLGADPEVRFTSSGKKVTTLRVAARCRKKEDTIWWKVSIWGEEYDRMIPFFKKGSAVIVRGYVNKPEIFTDREEKPQVSMSMTATSVDFSPFGKPEGSGEARGSHTPMQESYGEPSDAVAMGSQPKGVSFSDDEVPF